MKEIRVIDINEAKTELNISLREACITGYLYLASTISG